MSDHQYQPTTVTAVLASSAGPGNKYSAEIFERKAVAELISTDRAIQQLRSQPEAAQLIHDAYLEDDTLTAANRYSNSAEFQEVLGLLGPNIGNAVVCDIGAGRGIASWACIHAGALKVFALEPDASDVVGRGALAKVAAHAEGQIHVLDGVAEAIPLADNSVDIVFGRQVMHHMTNLDQAVREMVRVLRPGGQILMIREHVVDNDRQLRRFLSRHPVHKLAGGEHAFSVTDYTEAFASAGCSDLRVVGPWESIVNSAPMIEQRDQLESPATTLLPVMFGRLGKFASSFRLVVWMANIYITRDRPGRLYSFSYKQAFS